MMKNFTALLLAVALGVGGTAVAQTLHYGNVLYRINAGGEPVPTIDTSKVYWLADNYFKPSPYVDTLQMGNKVYEAESPVTRNGSVPPSTPTKIFATERSIDAWDIPQLEYNFQVPAGKTVEVRLYFAEIYFDSVGSRLFDILLENKTVLPRFDILSEAGKNVGLMKKFIVKSDGNLDIDFKRVYRQPKVNGIEIIEMVSDVEVTTGILASRDSKTTINAFPNPSHGIVKIDMGGKNAEYIRLFDSYGKEIQVQPINSMEQFTLELNNYPKGVYYLQVGWQGTESETLRLIKE